jgi:hypothetical protein
MFKLIMRLPVAWATKVLLGGTAVALVARFLFGSAVGLLLMSFALYAAMWQMGDTKPLTFGQLLIWIDELPSDAKTGVASSLLTVVGFLVAFHAAAVNWKDEAVADLKVKVADEFSSFYTEASRLIVKAQIYVGSLLEAAELFRTQGPSREAEFRIKHALEGASAFHAVRERLSAMSIEVHRLSGQHSSLLATVWSATEMADECEDAFGDVVKAMWVRVPVVLPPTNDVLGQFVSQVDVEECQRFLVVSDEHYDFINGTAGALRGGLLAPIIRFNIATLRNLYRQRRSLAQAVAALRRERP